MTWDPNLDLFSRQEQEHQNGTSNISVSVRATSLRKLNIDILVLKHRLGGVSKETALATLNGTTQLATRDGNMPLHKRYCSRQQQLKYRRLNATFYSDTMISSTKSSSGNLYSQIFVNNTNFVYQYPMKLKSQASDALQQFIHDIGIPNHMHT
ncbi:MAG: hypothetical protein ACRDL7_07290, partial [Gaiellaceae bacterium]